MRAGFGIGTANRPHGGFGLAVCSACLALTAALPSSSRAQGQDSTVAERNLLVMAELLPGLYDNANQAYFDRRRGLPDDDRHRRVSVEIRRIEAPAFGRYAFLWSATATGPDGKAQREDRIVTLDAGPGDDEVTMRHYLRTQGLITAEELAVLRPGDLRRTDGCDYVFKRRADHFRGVQRPRACRFEWQGNEVYTDNEIQLSRSSLWYVDHKFVAVTGVRVTGVASGEPYWLERARVFHCYADIPGVGGGRNVPFERYDDIRLHDKGGTHWFRTRPTAAEPEERELGVSLQAVTWHVLNERNGNFNRNSLVLYVMERMPDGSIKEHGYAFTDPGADRIGHNLKWILVNCAITPRDQARPEM